MTPPPLPLLKSAPRSALPRLDRHKPKGGVVRSSRSSRFRAIVLIAVHLLIGIHVVQWLMSGTTVSPVEPSEAGYLLDAGKLNTGFILFVVLILGTGLRPLVLRLGLPRCRAAGLVGMAARQVRDATSSGA